MGRFLLSGVGGWWADRDVSWNSFTLLNLEERTKKDKKENHSFTYVWSLFIFETW